MERPSYKVVPLFKVVKTFKGAEIDVIILNNEQEAVRMARVLENETIGNLTTRDAEWEKENLLQSQVCCSR